MLQNICYGFRMVNCSLIRERSDKMATNASNFGISNATYGRSTAGQKAIVNNFQGDIERALKALDADNAEYKALRKTISDNWSGADANAFLKLLDDKRTSIQSKVKKFKSAYSTVINEDNSKFIAGQKRIASNMGEDKVIISEW